MHNSVQCLPERVLFHHQFQMLNFRRLNQTTSYHSVIMENLTKKHVDYLRKVCVTPGITHSLKKVSKCS